MATTVWTIIALRITRSQTLQYERAISVSQWILVLQMDWNDDELVLEDLL
jgi:hypothetical protein